MFSPQLCRVIWSALFAIQLFVILPTFFFNNKFPDRTNGRPDWKIENSIIQISRVRIIHRVITSVEDATAETI